MPDRSTPAVPSGARLNRGRELTHQLRKNISEEYMQLQVLLRTEPLSVQTELALSRMKLRTVSSLRALTELELMLDGDAADLPRPAYCCVDQILQSAADTLNDILFADTDIRIEYRRGEQEIWSVLDAPRMERILFSVIENTMQYRPECERITLEAKAKGKRLFLSVKETGAALAPEQFALLFRKYTAVTSGTLDPSVRQGLSLALAEQAAREMDGSLTAENASTGLKFVLCLPLLSGRVNEESAVRTPEPEAVLALFADLLVLRIQQRIARLQSRAEQG